MISNQASGEAVVWIWLPGAVDPVAAGRLVLSDGRHAFAYGRSYLERDDAIAIYHPELPLRPASQFPPTGLEMAGCLRDAAPDAWGRRVVSHRHGGGDLAEIDYLLHSGSDRIGALDFQRSASEYEPRGLGATRFEDLLDLADRVEAGAPLSPELDIAVFHGSSIGGARPKATIEVGGRKCIGKFAARADRFDVVKAEFVAMRLADRVGLDVATVALEKVAGQEVLLIERFDRRKRAEGWVRRSMVSALTLFGLDEMMARYASYRDLADIVRHRFVDPTATLRELYGRLVFNVLCGNTDDHARNHAAFWDGAALRLTPAYDICPQPRTGGEASQAMLIEGENRSSTLVNCLAAASRFRLSTATALELIEGQIETIRDAWPLLVEEAGLTAMQAGGLWRRRLLNPFAFEDAPARLTRFAAAD